MKFGYIQGTRTGKDAPWTDNNGNPLPYLPARIFSGEDASRTKLTIIQNGFFAIAVSYKGYGFVLCEIWKFVRAVNFIVQYGNHRKCPGSLICNWFICTSYQLGYNVLATVYVINYCKYFYNGIKDCYLHFDFKLKDLRMIPSSIFSCNRKVHTVILRTLRTLTD